MLNYKILREIRLKHGYKSKEIAKLVNVSQSAISEYEKGVYEPSIDTLIKLSEIYGVSLNYLLLGEDTSLAFAKEEIDLISKSLKILTLKFELLKLKEDK